MPNQRKEVMRIGNKAKCRICKNENGEYHVFLNDVDVSEYVSDFHLRLSGGSPSPVITLSVPTSCFDCDVWTEIERKAAGNAEP